MVQQVRKKLVGFLLCCLAPFAWGYDVVSDPVAEAHLAEELQAWSLQASQMTKEWQALHQALTGLAPNQYQWAQTTPLLNQVGELLRAHTELAYNAENREAYFQAHFPGYQVPEDEAEAYQANLNQTLTLLNNSLSGLHLSASDFLDENKRLTFLQAQVSSATGQTAAIQASSQIAAEMVAEEQLLRQTLTQQANTEAAYEATQLQEAATQQATLHQLLLKACQTPTDCKAQAFSMTRSLS